MSPGEVVSSADELRRIYAETKRIAVVGASDSAAKPAHYIPRYLASQGYRILPVNPRGGRILDEEAFASLGEVPAPIDVVDVFRPPAEALTVAREAVEAGAKVLWFQPGTGTADAVRYAADAGLTVVNGACMGRMHARLGLGPGP